MFGLTAVVVVVVVITAAAERPSIVVGEGESVSAVITPDVVDKLPVMVAEEEAQGEDEEGLVGPHVDQGVQVSTLVVLVSRAILFSFWGLGMRQGIQGDGQQDEDDWPRHDQAVRVQPTRFPLIQCEISVKSGQAS